MSDEFSNWQRRESRSSSEKKPLDVKWRATHGAGYRTKSDNPYKAEAERDRVIFRWVMISVFIVACIIYLLFFLIPNS
jgi:hypothetical protein